MTISEREITDTDESHLTGEQIEAFERQQPIMDRIMENGMAEYVETLPNLGDAFDLEKHKPTEDSHKCLCCIDGRTPFGQHLPGSGILSPEAEFKEAFKKSGADSISWHDDCGAAQKRAKEEGFDGDANLYAKAWTEKMAEEMGVPCVHLGVEGPHSERVCYFDKTGKFNFAGVEGLPNGFIVSDLEGISNKTSQDAIKLSISIAFGDHGFGEHLLNEKNPFVLVAVANTKKELQETREELAKIAEPFGTKVVIDGFLAPQE